MNEHYFHCASKGLEDDVLFCNEEQFIAGMNRVALCYLSVRKSFPISVLAFCLMDNHVHFILYCSEDACKMFARQYRRLTEMWLHFHKERGKGNSWVFGQWIIPNREKLAEKICYVIRNPAVAGMGMHPVLYRWGSGCIMFADSSFHKSVGKIVSEYSINSQRRLFSTRYALPQDWIILPGGMIWPGCYVDSKRAEGIFGNVWNFMFELNKKMEDTVNIEMYGDTVSLPDKDVLGLVTKAAGELFAGESIDLLTAAQRLELCRYLRRTRDLNVKQLGRILHLRASELKGVL